MKNITLEKAAALAVKTYKKDASLRGIMDAKKLLDEFGTEVLNAGPEPLGVYCSILNRLVEFDSSQAKFAETMNNAFLFTHKTPYSIGTYLNCQIILWEEGKITTNVLRGRTWQLTRIIKNKEFISNEKDKPYEGRTFCFVSAVSVAIKGFDPRLILPDREQKIIDRINVRVARELKKEEEEEKNEKHRKKDAIFSR